MRVQVKRTISWVVECDESAYRDFPTQSDDGVQMSYAEIRKWEESQAVGDILESLEYAKDDEVNMTCEVTFNGEVG